MSEKVGVAVKKPESKGKDSAASKPKAEFSPSGSISSPVEQILHLQRTIGNQAVSRMIRSGAIRTKLSIGQPGDIYEQEADRVAEQVMRMTEEKQSLASGHLSLVQRQSGCPGCEEEETPISRKESGSCGGADVMSCVESHINALKGGGQSLSPSTRSFFEPRFGSDFSNVRVHTGSDAGAIATEINAKAFTTGRDIFFGAGQYLPGTTSGKNLLAHELTHVIQQSCSKREAGIARLNVNRAGYCQRFAACGGSEECPSRVSGELGRSQRDAMFVGSVSGPDSGLLVANYAVGSGDLKSDLQSNPAWANFWGQMVTNPNIQWDIIGFSDCQGGEGTNVLLRWQRAIAVNNALPQLARNQVIRFAAAPLSDCIAANTTEQGRMYNRSALIRRRITSYDFGTATVTANPFAACFDGTTVYVLKNGLSDSCPAVTGTIGAPTPAGTYLIRRQGDAQRDRWYNRDRSSWYLLEPQFTTTRSRMQLHPGSFSAGCITVTDTSCFSRLATILNGPGTVTGAGYDGYPPGNSEGVTNPASSVTGVGWLKVVSSGGCAFMRGSTAGGGSTE